MKTVMSLVMVTLLCWSASIYAAKPTNISFDYKQTTFFGKTYYVYQVSCSNGRRGKISGWNNKQEWCQGTSQKDCKSSLLQAATLLCN